MAKLQEKAQGQVKQMVGQMIGDDQLEREGREQLRRADQAGRDASPDASTGKPTKVSPRARSKEKR